jgi:hypothetical protein
VVFLLPSKRFCADTQSRWGGGGGGVIAGAPDIAKTFKALSILNSLINDILENFGSAVAYW